MAMFTIQLSPKGKKFPAGLKYNFLPATTEILYYANCFKWWLENSAVYGRIHALLHSLSNKGILDNTQQ